MEKVSQIEYQNQLYDIQDTEAQKNLAYSYTETDTGKIWVDGNRIFRKVVDCGQLPNIAEKVVNTGIKIKNLVKLQGFAYHQTNNTIITLPFSSSGNFNIAMYISNNNISIVTNTNRTDYTKSYAILEYTKAE